MSSFKCGIAMADMNSKQLYLRILGLHKSAMARCMAHKVISLNIDNWQIHGNISLKLSVYPLMIQPGFT